jgi:hypothetical protein
MDLTCVDLACKDLACKDLACKDLAGAALAGASLVGRMQFAVQLHGALVSQTLNGPRDRITSKQQITLTG